MIFVRFIIRILIYKGKVNILKVSVGNKFLENIMVSGNKGLEKKYIYF